MAPLASPGYSYDLVYICLFEGVHLRLAVEGKMYLYVSCFQIFIHIAMLIAKYNHYETQTLRLPL